MDSDGFDTKLIIKKKRCEYIWSFSLFITLHLKIKSLMMQDAIFKMHSIFVYFSFIQMVVDLNIG